MAKNETPLSDRDAAALAECYELTHGLGLLPKHDEVLELVAEHGRIRDLATILAKLRFSPAPK